MTIYLHILTLSVISVALLGSVLQLLLPLHSFVKLLFKADNSVSVEPKSLTESVVCVLLLVCCVDCSLKMLPKCVTVKNRI